MAVIDFLAPVKDHSNLTNLDLDSHPNMPRSSGRAVPAQWLIGSTLSGGSLVLKSTSGAVLGTVEAGPLVVDEEAGQVGVGVAEPGALLHVGGPLRVDNDTDDAGRALILGSLVGDTTVTGMIGYFLVEWEGGLYRCYVASHNGSTIPGAVVPATFGVQLLWDVAGAAAAPADEFTAGDVQHPMPASTSGHTWTPWGTSWWGISSNEGYLYSHHSSDAASMCSLSGQAADGTVSVTLAALPTNAHMGLILRGNPTNKTGYFVGMYGPTGAFVSAYWTGTTWSGYRTLGGGIPPAAGQVLSVQMSGQQFTVKVDGMQIDQANGYTTEQTNADHGLFVSTGSDWPLNRFDDYSFAP